ncbi:MAG: CDP-diacylglycerol diphosphatase [Stigonema ocellatum SAG 48.90 = DSM 106950]|nr:CDP-diacylglycerol diphosphatase [Stigonema ocellatum SAG 48.90 = DSM 106950]
MVKHWIGNRALALSMGLLAGCASSTGMGLKSDALWHIVHDRCVPGQEHSGNPRPCVSVDLKDGYAVLKDKVGVAQYLLIPTAAISGIESPTLLEKTAPEYWRYAWEARDLMSQHLRRKLRRDEIALAVNSAYGRSQNQLHIHIDCISLETRSALLDHLSAIGTDWAALPIKLNGHTYRARRIYSKDLRNVNPFLLLAQEHEVQNNMRAQTLVIVGVKFENGSEGFILLADTANWLHGDRGSGEELLDHSCAVAIAP